MTLAETQALFHEAVTSPTPLDPARLETCFAGTPGLPAAARVAIYADMYRWRLVDGLSQSFPCLARFLGHDELGSLAEDYLHRHPSEHHDLSQVGRHLAAFLREHPDRERPDLSDLASLEWARQEVFFAATAEPAGPELFAGLTPEVLSVARLALSPALRLLRLDHDVAPLWRALEDGAPPAPLSPGAAAVAVWRTGLDVVHGVLPLDEATALEAALSGASLATVCAAFGGDDPAGAAHRALSSWLSEGWLVGLG